MTRTSGALLRAVIVLMVTTSALGEDNFCNVSSSVNGVLTCRGLTTFPPSVPVTIRELDFYEVHQETLQQMNYSHVTTLTIRNSEFKNIVEGAFSAMTNLTTLALENNLLDQLRANMFSGLLHLRTLELNNNRFTFIPPEMFEELPALTTLELNDNQGLMLNNDTFASTTMLSSLELRHLGLTSVPTGVFRSILTLTYLNLNQNNFSVLRNEAFEYLSGLLQLELDGCSITTVEEEAFDGLFALVSLKLSNNEITSLPRSVFTVFTNLEELHLEGNMLARLSEDVINWEQLHQFYLGHNPWNCDCKISWMKRLDIQHKDQENVTCQSPDKFSGYNLHNVTESMMCDAGNGSTVALAIAIPIMIAAVVLIGYYGYKLCQSRRQKSHHASHHYSAVYRDTTEARQILDRPTSEL